MSRSRRLGEEKIGPLLVRLSLPAAVGLSMHALYNLVDTIFVGRGVGTLGIAGIAICFPVQTVFMALASMFGIGSASIVSRSLGAGDKDRAEAALGNLVTLSLVFGGAIAVLGSLFAVPALRLFGATDAVLPYALDYYRVIVAGSPLFVFALGVNAVVRGEGNARVAMGTMLVSGGLNIALDPLFIFGLGMGLRGAAVATVIAQAVTSVYLLYYFLGGRSGLALTWRGLRPRWAIVRETCAVGGGSFARLIAGSLMTIVLNNTLAVYGGELAIAAFGMINRMIMFLFLPMIGVVQGLQPVVGYNYGARQPGRAWQAVRLAIAMTTGMSLISFVLLFAFPGPLMRVFSQDPELIALSAEASRMIVLALPLVGFQLVVAGAYQALGRALPALVLALLRQVILFIPLVLVLPRHFGLSGVWIAYPLADLLAAALTLVFLLRVGRELAAQAKVLAAPAAP